MKGYIVVNCQIRVTIIDSGAFVARVLDAQDASKCAFAIVATFRRLRPAELASIAAVEPDVLIVDHSFITFYPDLVSRLETIENVIEVIDDLEPPCRACAPGSLLSGHKGVETSCRRYGRTIEGNREIQHRFVCGRCSPDRLADEIVAAGASILASVADRRASALPTVYSENSHNSVTLRISDLPDREQEVARALCRGLSNKAIARELNMSYRTVGNHAGRIYRRFDWV